MSDLVTHTAIIGRTQLMPGILPVNVDSPKVQCLVAHTFPASIKNEYHNIDLDISDCTLFTVTHVGLADIDLSDATMAEKLLEQALMAIGEVIIWNKAMDLVGTVSAFMRQVGRLDVKFFFIVQPNNRLISWKNPLFWSNRESAALMAGFLGNMILNNGPAANHVAEIIRRVMSSLDLVNLGFYTESFVNLFSLVDDLTQEVIKKGMEKKGLSNADQKDLLRAIKEERLKLYLTQLAKLCDWKSLEDENPGVFKKLMKANRLRNDVMHNSTRLQRQQALESGNDLLITINWLRVNPFGYVIPPFPLLKVAETQFILLEPKDDAGKDK